MATTTNIRASAVYVFAFIAMLVLLPWSYRLSTYAIIVMSIAGLFSLPWKEKLQRLREHPQVYIFLFFYLLYVIGLFYAQNQASARSGLEQKLSLILPLLVATSVSFTEKQQRTGAMAFVYSTVALTVACFTLSIIGWSQGDIMNHNFDSHTLARFADVHSADNPIWMRLSYVAFVNNMIDPTYLSMYLVLSIAILFYFPMENKKRNTLRWIITGWFFIVVILLSSRIGILLLGLVAGLIILFKSESKTKALVYLFAFFAVLIASIFLSPVTRFRMIEEPLSTPMTFPENPTQWNSTNLRLIEWSGGIEGIKHAGILGTGTGGTHAALQNYYDQFDLGDFNNGYNAHNQYIETFLEIGIAGFLTLLAIFLFPLLYAWRIKNNLLLYLVLIVAGASLTECVLERAFGIIFYMSFISLFMFTKSTE